MAKAKKTKAEAPEDVRKAPDGQEVSQDVREAQSAPGTSGGRQEEAVPQEVIGPPDESELMGCQEDEAELAEALFIEYAVSGCEHLRLRQQPSQDAPVVALLPCGVGVLGSDGPAEDGWRQVFTGRLFGWVMDRYLEPLELPELDDGAD